MRIRLQPRISGSSFLVRHTGCLPIFFSLIALVLALPQPSPAGSFKVLYNFSTPGPATSLVQDAHGNLYGVGSNNAHGYIFKLDPQGNLSTLYTFDGGRNGGSPNPDLALDSQDNLYGTANQGGANGGGVIFKLSRVGRVTVLYDFCSQQRCQDGTEPRAGVIRDDSGSLYGTTLIGGPGDGGVVYKLDATGKYSMLYGFRGGNDGLWPFAPPTLDKAGNLYGTTVVGGKTGNHGCQFPPGCGIVYKIGLNGKETILHKFAWGTDGVGPYGSVVVDRSGNVYGTTFIGGSDGCPPPPPQNRGCGTIYKVDTSGKETVLYRWKANSPYEYDPYAGLVRDKQGNLYGATYAGGTFSCDGGTGCGTIFKFDTTKGKLTVLHTFTGGRDGGFPRFRLLLDAGGNLFGTSLGDSSTGIPGTLFRITP